MLELLLGFLKVGCFSFGGAYAAIPLIRDVVLSAGWLDDEMLTAMIAVSESTPGPIMVNMATYVGMTHSGLPGALLATTAVVLPAFFIIVLITALLSKVIENRYVQAVLRGVTPCMIGIIGATGLQLTAKYLFQGTVTAPDFRAIGIAAGLAMLYFSKWFGAFRPLSRFSKKISPIMLILLGAVLGIIVYGI